MSIILTDIVKRLKGKIVLDVPKLEINDGTVVALCGENGSGKTMLLRAIAGLIKPNQGCVSIDGALLWRDIAFPQSVGVLIESPAFIEYETGFENLKQLSGIKQLINEQDICKTMGEVGLDPLSKEKYRQYSLGMKQALGIAAAVMEHPKIVLLDEPTNALDEAGVCRLRQIIQQLRRDGATFVIASHDRSFFESIADSVVRMREGKVVTEVN